jgi:cysteinyl-tRNA synthetase
MVEPLEPRTFLSVTEPDDFVYQLQNVNLAAMAKTKFDLAVIDYSADGSDATAYTPTQIRHLRNGSGGHKTVLAYLSIGEAENYRWYWGAKWDRNNDGVPDHSAPTWLGPQNPDWVGNYEVKYWDPSWQRVVRLYLDKIISAGFSGAYFDIVDAYEYWQPSNPNAESQMVQFVESLAAYARAKAGPSFQIFVQNASELGPRHPDYLATVSGIGAEDTWYNDNTPNRLADINETLANLDAFHNAGKPVLCIDYVTKRNLVDDFFAKANARGFAAYTSDRELDTLTIWPGHEPD